MTYKSIPIDVAQAILEEFDRDEVIIITWSKTGDVSLVTAGSTPEHRLNAARGSVALSKYLEKKGIISRQGEVYQDPHGLLKQLEQNEDESDVDYVHVVLSPEELKGIGPLRTITAAEQQHRRLKNAAPLDEFFCHTHGYLYRSARQVKEVGVHDDHRFVCFFCGEEVQHPEPAQ